jgi:hypothetical protein
VRAEIFDLVRGLAQLRDDALVERIASVICCDGDTHEQFSVSVFSFRFEKSRRDMMFIAPSSEQIS